MKSNIYFGIIITALFIFAIEKSKAQAPDWLWAKGLAGIYSAVGTSIFVDPGNGDVYTTGWFTGTADFDPGQDTFNLIGPAVFISKLDALGNFVWAKSIGGNNSSSISVNPVNGDVYFTGDFYGTVDFDPGPGIFNLNSNLNPEHCIYSDCPDIFISKLDRMGNFVWAKSIGGEGSDEVFSIAVDPSEGDVYTYGNFIGTVDFDPGIGTFYLTSNRGNTTAFISKLDGLGNFIWAQSISGTYYFGGTPGCSSIAVDPKTGNVYTTGRFYGTVDFNSDTSGIFNLTSFGSGDIFISKLESSGNFIWAKSIGAESSDEGLSIAIDQIGGFVYVTGVFAKTVDFDPGPAEFLLSSNSEVCAQGHYCGDIFILKLDSSGNFVWANAIGGTAEDIGNAIALDPSGSGAIYTTGYFNRTVDFDPGAQTYNLIANPEVCYDHHPICGDIFILKLDSSGNFVWAKGLGGIYSDAGTSIIIDHSGHLLITGYFHSPSLSIGSFNFTNANGDGSSIFGYSPDLFIAKLDTAFTTSVVNIDSDTPQIKLYPNPATNELTIEFDDGKFINVGITMINTLGEVVFSSPVENILHQKTIDISALVTGIYFMELNIDGNSVVRKVLKE